MPAKRIKLDPALPLRSAREQLGLTQEEAAERAGAGRSGLGNAEQRGDGITVGTLRKWLAKLGRELQIVAIEAGEEKEGDDT